MQIRMYCVLFLLLIKNLSFSQSIKEAIGSQFDKIALSLTKDKEFVVSAFVSNRVYIIKRAKDSLYITSYGTTISNEIGGVYSISIFDDTLFTKTVDTLYSDIKQNHNYQSYSQRVLTSGNFFLTFYEKDKLQIFCRKEALQNQLTMVESILNRLSVYSITPFSGSNRRKKFLKIDNWNELLKYLKSGSVDSIPK